MLLFHWCLFLSICGSTISSVGPIVKTPLGKIMGWESLSRAGRAYQAFTNIPYGMPTSGKLRFKAPLPVSKWQGVYNATSDMPNCVQVPFNGWQDPSFFMTEDCLRLNLYRPKEPRVKAMPVLVHFLGGANMIGVQESRDNARYMMDEDVILVEPSYRVFSFGLLSLGDDVMPGNYMYKDQTLALKWVKNNIASFGGNPNRVIVMGVSSGAISCHALINSPLTQGLIHGGYSISGTMEPFESFPANLRVLDISQAIIEYVGCDKHTSEETLECLQAMDATELAVGTLMGKYDPIHIAMGLVIEPETVEGAFMTENPFRNLSKIPFVNMVSNGEVVEADEDMKYDPQYPFEAYKDIDQHLTDYMNMFFNDQDLIQEKVGKLKKRYFPEPQSLTNFTFRLETMYSDVQFLYPALHNSRFQNGPTWLGYLEYKSDQSPLATYNYDLAAHAMVGDFIFDRNAPFPWSVPESARDYNVSLRHIRYLVDFANHLDPTPPGSPYYWPQFHGNRILRMQDKRDIVGDKEFIDKMLDFYYFWEDILGWW